MHVDYFKKKFQIAQSYSANSHFILFFVCLGLSVLSIAIFPNLMNAKSVDVESINLPANFEYPNGITHAPDGTIYVGSVTKGDIISISPDGAVHTVFKETVNSFAGTSLRFDPLTNILWVASPDFVGKKVDGKTVRRAHRIVAIDITKSKEIWSSVMPNKGFGNDFVLDGTGGVYITDSSQDLVLHLEAPGSAFKIIASHPLMTPGDLGPAGIVKLPNGNLVIGLWRDGALLHIEPKDKEAAKVTRLKFEHHIENPDGLALAPDGRLLILEGGIKSGNGKLLAVDLDQKQPYKPDVLLDNLDAPLNLTVKDHTVFITEGRVRHFIIKDDPNIKAPDAFRVIKLQMHKKSSRDGKRD